MKYQFKIRKFPNGNEFFIFRCYNFTREPEDIKNKNLKYSSSALGLKDLPCDFSFDDIEEFTDSFSRSLSNSLWRTKKTVREYCMCNLWEWFGTLTFSPDLVDRYDFELCSKKVRVFFNNLKTKNGYTDFKYLAIPERHKDGAWHFHVLFSGLPFELFSDSGVKQNGKCIYNFISYKLGFTNFSKVSDTQKVSNYILKYVSKSLLEIPNKQRFYCSKGLLKPTESIIDFECDRLSIIEMQKIIESYGKNITWLTTSHNFDDFYYFSVE